MVTAVLWDFGGVILSSPFDAFNEYEAANGIPKDFIRGINAVNPDTNAWAKFERSEIDFEGFDRLFHEESSARGHPVRGAVVAELIKGKLRPRMVEALRRCADRLRVGCITNNVADPTARDPQEHDAIAEVMGMFEIVVESSKVGMRKPDPKIYLHACELLGVQPSESAYLDDLGINLKPARALGMHTIKVIDPDVALAELEAVVGFPLR